MKWHRYKHLGFDWYTMGLYVDGVLRTYYTKDREGKYLVYRMNNRVDGGIQWLANCSTARAARQVCKDYV